MWLFLRLQSPGSTRDSYVVTGLSEASQQFSSSRHLSRQQCSRVTYSGPLSWGVTCEPVLLCERRPLKTHAGANGLESALKLLLKCCNKPKTVTLTKQPKTVGLSATPWTVASRLRGPWGSPGTNAAVRCHSLLQGIFPTQGRNPPLLPWQVVLRR